MSAAKSNAKKRRSEAQTFKPEHSNTLDDDIFGAELSSEIKGLMSALHQIKDKSQKDGQRKKEETISSVAADVKSKFDVLKAKIEKERQNFAKALSKSSKECESSLKNEISKFQAIHEKFVKDRAEHMRTLKGIILKYDDEKGKLSMRYEQQRKREKNMISEQEKACANKLAELEESLKKKKKDDKTFSILRKTLGSFLEPGSDEDFLADD